MLGISGGCFSVRLIHELDGFSVFEPVFGGASYTRVRLISCKYTLHLMDLKCGQYNQLLCTIKRTTLND